MPSNLYNFDKKGFLISLSRCTKQIVSYKVLKSQHILSVSQDGSQEFISLIVAICADGSHILPALIYKGKLHDMQDTWLDDFDDLKDSTFFASSKKGWSSDLLGIYWLQYVFDHSTREKVGRSWHLLIIDGHSSHVNFQFLDYMDWNQILINILLLHSTHQLQPLNVGLFSPLGTYYSQKVDNLLAKSQGLVSMIKRHFWALFRKAWRCVFIMKNIEIAWKVTGVHLFNPDKIITTITRETTLPECQQATAKTLILANSMLRTFNQLHRKGHTDMEAIPLLHAGMKLAADIKILHYEIADL